MRLRIWKPYKNKYLTVILIRGNKEVIVMEKVKLVLLLVLVVVVALTVLQNRAPAQVHFLWWAGELSAILLLFLIAAGGFIMGLLVALLAKGKTRS